MELGIKDDEFIRGNVPMTKQEIRILTLVKAQIRPRDIIYDIGAGTGSLSIEAARLALDGSVFALEKNPEAVNLIHQNMEKFGVDNLTVMETEAPEGMEHLPQADAVIIGGSGGEMAEILKAAEMKLKDGGRIVINCITIQTVVTALSYLREREDIFTYDAVQVQVNRLVKAGPYDMARSLNPVYIISCVKDKHKEEA